MKAIPSRKYITLHKNNNYFTFENNTTIKCPKNREEKCTPDCLMCILQETDYDWEDPEEVTFICGCTPVKYRLVVNNYGDEDD